MSLPFGHADTTFESFLQALPADYWELALEFKAFTRSRKIKTPAQLMQVVMGYCGLDAVLRETAGNFTLLEERISDTAIHNRLKACVPWVKALLSRMMGAAAQPLLEGHLRFLIIDGSTVQGPGAKGTWYRLHLAIDLVKLHPEATHPAYISHHLFASDASAIPDQIRTAFHLNSAARLLLVKGKTDYIAADGQILATINEPHIPTLEPIGGPAIPSRAWFRHWFMPVSNRRRLPSWRAARIGWRDNGLDPPRRPRCGRSWINSRRF